MCCCQKTNLFFLPSHELCHQNRSFFPHTDSEVREKLTRKACHDLVMHCNRRKVMSEAKPVISLL